MPVEVGGRDWKGIITAAASSGLGFFALIALVVSSGLIVAAVQVDNPTSKVVLSAGAVIVLLSMVVFVGRKELGKGSSPGFGQLQGTVARTSFLEGGLASKLDGRWQARWLAPDESGNMQPYMVKDDETGEMQEYPPDIIDLETRDAVISASAHDQTTRRVYWIEGRLSSRGIASLLYWSKAGTDEAKLVGVLILELKQTEDGGWAMIGPWIGYVRDNRMVHGEVEFTKLTRD